MSRRIPVTIGLVVALGVAVFVRKSMETRPAAEKVASGELPAVTHSVEELAAGQATVVEPAAADPAAVTSEPVPREIEAEAPPLLARMMELERTDPTQVVAMLDELRRKDLAEFLELRAYSKTRRTWDAPAAPGSVSKSIVEALAGSYAGRFRPVDGSEVEATMTIGLRMEGAQAGGSFATNVTGATAPITIAVANVDPNHAWTSRMPDSLRLVEGDWVIDMLVPLPGEAETTGTLFKVDVPQPDGSRKLVVVGHFFLERR